MGTGKRKIKNKPVTIKESTKLEGKINAFDKVKDFSKKAFKAALKVPKTVTKVADYIGRDEDLEREVKQDDIDKDER